MVVRFMIKLLKKQVNIAPTTRELGEYVLKNGFVPTPDYSRNKEYEFVVQERGIVFPKRNAKRVPPPRF